jgi:hypothetical protein
MLLEFQHFFSELSLFFSSRGEDYISTKETVQLKSF